MIQKIVFKSTRKVLSGVYFPGPFFPPCFREFQRDWYKYFDLVLEGVSSTPAMLKLRAVEIVICWEVYSDYQGCTLQINTSSIGVGNLSTDFKIGSKFFSEFFSELFSKLVLNFGSDFLSDWISDFLSDLISDLILCF